jgi:hypothetical protein
MGDKRRRTHDKLAALPGVSAVRRPVSPSAREEFDLYYVRTGPPSDRPLVIIPDSMSSWSSTAAWGCRATTTPVRTCPTPR